MGIELKPMLLAESVEEKSLTNISGANQPSDIDCAVSPFLFQSPIREQCLALGQGTVLSVF